MTEIFWRKGDGVLTIKASGNEKIEDIEQLCPLCPLYGSRCEGMSGLGTAGVKWADKRTFINSGKCKPVDADVTSQKV